MTVDRPRAPWCYYNYKPFSARAGPLSDRAGRLIDPLSNHAGRLIDPLSDSARPQPVLNRADRFIIRLNG